MIDHRKLGRELDLFDSDPLVGAGLPFWLPAGAAARYEVECYLRDSNARAGYQHVYSPPIGKTRDVRAIRAPGAFRRRHVPDDGRCRRRRTDAAASLCPHHAMVFASRGRVLPGPAGTHRRGRCRYSGPSAPVSSVDCHRVRAISLNDAHNFCALEQVGDEVARHAGADRAGAPGLGFAAPATGCRCVATAASSPASRRIWDRAEDLLRDALAGGRIFVEAPGEAAFYGPKIDVQIVGSGSAARRPWPPSSSTSISRPSSICPMWTRRAKQRPVMVHRSLVGVVERLFAHLIEIHGGAFPVWYAPVQIEAVPVSGDQAEPASAFARRCVRPGCASSVARRFAGRPGTGGGPPEVPYVAVIGAREAAAGEVSLRLRDGRQLPPMGIEAAIDMVRDVSAARSHDLIG